MSNELIHDFFLDPEFLRSHIQADDIFDFFKTAIVNKWSFILVRYPGRKAFRQVIGEERDKPGGRLSSVKSELIKEFILNHPRVMERRCSTWDGEKAWIENALTEDSRIPIHGVLTDCQTEDISKCISYSQGWAHPLVHATSTAIKVSRDAAEMARAFQKLFIYSSKLVVIDRYFDPSKESSLKPLSKFIETAMCGRIMNRPLTELQIHTGIQHISYGQPPSSFGYEPFCKTAREALPSLVPQGLKMEICFWEGATQKQEFHNRYILTEHFGIFLGAGTSQKKYSTDDVALMGEKEHSTQWYSVRGANPIYQKTHNSIWIDGAARAPVSG